MYRNIPALKARIQLLAPVPASIPTTTPRKAGSMLSALNASARTVPVPALTRMPKSPARQDRWRHSNNQRAGGGAGYTRGSE
jgi:hypothetical protein